MPKINKVYPPFYNGVSQQAPELILDNQCKEMSNCVPDLVRGLRKRPPVKFQAVRDYATYPLMEDAVVFHTYDRGEDDEEYIFVETGDSTDPVLIYDKDGNEMNISYADAAVKTYLANGSLKGLTVQDRTWIFSKSVQVDLDYTATTPLNEDYDKTAFYWIKRGSADRYNPFNYAVYLDNITVSCNPVKPKTGDLESGVAGFEDSDFAAAYLADVINGNKPSSVYPDYVMPAGETDTFEVYLGENLTNFAYTISGTNITSSGVSYSATTGYVTFTITNTDGSNEHTAFCIFEADMPSGWNCEKSGSILKIWKDGYADFDFSSWDSWGNQASEGWKGSVNKITDLPKDMIFEDVYVKIKGDEGNAFQEYFVKWNGSSWEECLDPQADRGQLTNMPIKCDRTALVAGVATFTLDFIDWSTPRVGNYDNNPDPSFAPSPEGYKRTIQDLFFYKNRLGIAAEDSITLSETANYTNFYATTAIDIVDTDVVDITVATNQASQIYFAKPFNNSLYIFTKYAQYELVADGIFTPSTVALDNASNYPMATDVEPVVVNDSLYFISTTNNRQQLREYIKSDNLSVKGIDLNTGTPTYLDKPIKKIIADGVLGYVLCCTDENTVYLYNYKEDGTNRVQSAWSTWNLLEDLTTLDNSYEYFSIASTLLVICKTATDYRYHKLQLDYNVADDNLDTSASSSEYPYESKVVLPDYYPKLSDIRTPKDKMLIKKITIEGDGAFDADVYRKDYDTTYSKSHSLGLADLDLHVASKVGNCVITVKDSSANDFQITSIVVEGLFSTTSKELK